jgi:hypothetical protein
VVRQRTRSGGEFHCDGLAGEVNQGERDSTNLVTHNRLVRRLPVPGYTIGSVLASRKRGKMKTFEISFRYQDRNNSSEGSTVKLDASSLPGAVAKATREFVKALDRKQRFDMNKNGLEIKAVLLAAATPAKESGGTAAAASS